MVRIPSPGEYVLLQRPGRPDWPAMICTDDMAPSNLRRPNGYLTLVLLIEQSPTFYYAASRELQEFVPIGDDPNKELQAAHNRVLESMDSSWSSLDYWRLRIEHQRRPSSFTVPPLTMLTPTPSPSSDHIFDQESDSDEIDIAKSLSLRAWNESRNRTRSSPSRPRTFKQARGATDLREHFGPTESEDSTISTGPEAKRYKPVQKDYIDGELSASGELVKVHVGTRNDEFLIPKSEVEKLPFLSDPQIGCMSITEDGTLRLDLQCLHDFDPAHFRFVAEFLSTGQFGHSIVDEQTREAVLEECADAWPIADRIVLEDMLDYIVTKVQQAQVQEWELAWTLALMVYETSGTPLNAYKIMKELLVEVIADDFLAKVDAYATEHGNDIIDHLRDLPELERDIYRRLLEAAEQRVGES
ncbi:hypothetical protein PMIN02_002730 [Paraphaeosphaeria minitans]|uniref:PWWP domain-containing protein n=1 Tax=Paraphaeosphaeria minitans TaxID=565426 RepID=A0A9P6KUQ8_9PLEO|nr:hypothetical protein PMIN01_02803 [Paraphaeosphaeria minitans]